MSEMSYILDEADFKTDCPIVLAHWNWSEVCTPEMRFDFKLLSGYMKNLFPDHETFLELHPPRALHNGETILPSLQFSCGCEDGWPFKGGRFSSACYSAEMSEKSRLMSAASDWANSLLEKNHLAIGAKLLCSFRKLKEGDIDVIETEKFYGAPLSSRQTSEAQARFGPLPK